METKRKRGRPRKDIRRNKQINVRVTDETLYRLNQSCYLNEKNKTEVIEEALRMYYNLAKFNGINASKKYTSDK